MDLSHITTKDMATEAKREVIMRERVYARRVIDGKMNQDQADHGIAVMKAIQFKLERLARDEDAQGDLFEDKAACK